MYPNLAKVIRPSQTPDIRPTRPAAYQAVLDEPDPQEIVWGSSGDSVFAATAHTKGFVDNNNTNEEVSRKYDVVRVKNPDDTDQHVDFEVMTEYQARNTITKDRTTLRFEKTQPTGTVQILSTNNKRTQNLP